MNAKNIGIIGLLIIVVVAFTGLASAATQQVLVSDAYDEQVLVSDAYDEQVLVSDAYDEQSLVSEEQNGVVNYADQIFNTVDEWANWIWAQPNSTGGWGGWDPVYATVVDQEAYDEIIDPVYETVTVVDQEAYDEYVEPVYETVTVVDQEAVPASDVAICSAYYYSNGAATSDGHWYVRHGYADSFTVEKIDRHLYVLTLFEHHDAIPAVTHEEQQLVSEGYYVHHDAVTHEEQQLVSEGYTIHHDAVTHQVIDHYLVHGQYYTHVDAVYETIHHDAVYQTIHHDAVYETVHHPAVYKLVEVADPVVPVDDPVVSEPAAVEPVSEPVSVPMQKTGGDLTAVGVALAAIIAGMFIPVIARRRNNDDEE